MGKTYTFYLDSVNTESNINPSMKQLNLLLIHLIKTYAEAKNIIHTEFYDPVVKWQNELAEINRLLLQTTDGNVINSIHKKEKEINLAVDLASKDWIPQIELLNLLGQQITQLQQHINMMQEQPELPNHISIKIN